MALNEEPNRPDPVLRAFTEMIEATFPPKPKYLLPDPDEFARRTDRTRQTESDMHDLREALRELDEQITELIGLLYELRRAGRPDDYKPFA
jgi:hypothetical protein